MNGDTDWRPSVCPQCGRLRHAARHPICKNPLCSMNGISKTTNEDINKIGQAKMITAKEARMLAGPTDAEAANLALESVFAAIRKAAENKQRSITLRGDFWSEGGYRDAKSYKIAVERLEELDFDVRFFYEENQFVDAGVVISW